MSTVPPNPPVGDQPPPPQPTPPQPTPQQPYQQQYPTQTGYPAAGAGYAPAGYQPATQPIRRPWNVTLVALLTLLLGILDVVAGVLMLVFRNNIQFAYDIAMTPQNIFYAGIGAIVIGAVVMLLGFGLFGGSRFCRGVIALICFLRIAVGIIVIIVALGSNTRIEAGVHALLSIVVLLLLFGGARTKRFFRES